MNHFDEKYYSKYLKYKEKYLDLKNSKSLQNGGLSALYNRLTSSKSPKAAPVPKATKATTIVPPKATKATTIVPPKAASVPIATKATPIVSPKAVPPKAAQPVSAKVSPVYTPTKAAESLKATPVSVKAPELPDINLFDIAEKMPDIIKKMKVRQHHLKWLTKRIDIIIKKITENIQWALQNPKDAKDIYEKIVKHINIINDLATIETHIKVLNELFKTLNEKQRAAELYKEIPEIIKALQSQHDQLKKLNVDILKKLNKNRLDFDKEIPKFFKTLKAELDQLKKL
jgi:hypothetical protein